MAESSGSSGEQGAVGTPPPGGPDRQIAQLGQEADAIGNVGSLTGAASVLRQGETLLLSPGDSLFEGDLLQTGSAAEITVVFADGTTFSLSPNASMVLESYLYAPEESDNGLNFGLLQGTFVFITGALTEDGDFVVETPVALIGIRGTSPAVRIEADQATSFSILPDPDGQVGSYSLFSRDGGELITLIDDPARLVTIAALGEAPFERALAPDEITDFYLLRNRGTDSLEQNREQPEEEPQSPFDPNNENDRDPGARDSGRGGQRGDAGEDGEGSDYLQLGELLSDLGPVGPGHPADGPGVLMAHLGGDFQPGGGDPLALLLFDGAQGEVIY